MKDIRDMKYQTDREYVFFTPIKPQKRIERNGVILEESGKLIVPKGYLYNGADVVIDTPDLMLHSLEHDVFCNLIHDEEVLPLSTRPKVDDLLDQRLEEESRKWAKSNFVKLALYDIRRWYIRRAIQAHVKLRYGL